MKRFLRSQTLFTIAIVIAGFLFTGASQCFAATITSTTTGGFWNAAATWEAISRTGSISVTAGSTLVSGSGAFTNNLAVGSILKTSSGVLIGTVQSIEGPNSLSLANNAPSSYTNISYTAQMVPTASDAVTIATGATVTVGVAATALSVTVSNPASLIVNNTITIANTGSVTVNGTLEFNNTGKIAGGGSGGNGVIVSIANGATLITASPTGINGSIATTVGNRSHSFSTGANYIFNGADVIQTVNNNLPATVANLTLNGSGIKMMPATSLTVTGNLILGGTAAVTAGNNITVGGNLTIGSGTILNAASFTLFVAGNWTNSGTFNAVSSTVNFNGTAAQTIGGPTTFNNLTLSNTAAPVFTTADITAAGTLSVQAGAVLSPDASNTVGGTGTLAGNGTVRVTRTAATADFSTQYSVAGKSLANLTVEYTGTSAQTVSAISYGGLKINNGYGVTLAGSATVTGTLTLTDGMVTVPASYSLILTSSTPIAGASFGAARHIATLVNTSTGTKGSLQVNNITTSGFTFPVGNGTYYLPITLTPESSNDFRVTAFTGITENGQPNGITYGAKEDGINVVWDVNRSAGTGDVSMRMYWPKSLQGANFAVDAGSRIGIMHHDGTIWERPEGTGTKTNNDITMGTAYRTGIQSFSPFSVATEVIEDIVTPVRFTGIKAMQASGGTQISWSNATEEEVQKYVVERSSNGRSFTALAELAPAGNNNKVASYLYLDQQPLSGDVYYRIRAVENSGKATYSAVAKVGAGSTGISLNIYPNPVKGSQISFTANNLPEGMYSIKMYSATGQLLSAQMFNHKGGFVSQTLELNGAKSGHYMLEVKGVVRMVKHVVVQ